jgi:hypothetical protein
MNRTFPWWQPKIIEGRAGAPPLTALLAAVVIGCAGCASQGSAAGNSGTATGTLTVFIEQVGGPSTNGETPHKNLPDITVKMTAGGTSTTAVTDRTGRAVFHVAPGSYAVSVAACGSENPETATVPTAGTASLTWVCPIP